MARKQGTYDETTIVEGCVNNKRKFQEILYRQQFEPMMNMVMRYAKDQETALDILNQGFLRVFRKIDTYSGKGSLQGWIRRIVYHSISDHYRKESSYLKFIVLDEVDKETRSDALDGLYYEELLEIVESLPEKSRVVFKMYAIDGYPHKEIAESLGISEGTSKWHLSNARVQLKKLIKKRAKQQYAG